MGEHGRESSRGKCEESCDGEHFAGGTARECSVTDCLGSVMASYTNPLYALQAVVNISVRCSRGGYFTAPGKILADWRASVDRRACQKTRSPTKNGKSSLHHARLSGRADHEQFNDTYPERSLSINTRRSWGNRRNTKALVAAM